MAAILLASITIFTTKANAQNFGVGAGLSIFSPTLTSSGGGISVSATGDMQVGIAIKPYYNLNGKMRIDAHALIYFGTSKSATVETGVDPNTFQPIYSTITDKTSLIGFGANFQYAFMGEFAKEGITLYGLAGFSDLIMKTTESGSGADVSSSQGFFDFNIGVGGEYNFNSNLCIFIEPRYSLGIAGASDAGVTTKLSGFNMDAGVRYNFGK